MLMHARRNMQPVLADLSGFHPASACTFSISSLPPLCSLCALGCKRVNHYSLIFAVGSCLRNAHCSSSFTGFCFRGTLRCTFCSDGTTPPWRLPRGRVVDGKRPLPRSPVFPASPGMALGFMTGDHFAVSCHDILSNAALRTARRPRISLLCYLQQRPELAFGRFPGSGQASLDRSLDFRTYQPSSGQIP